MTLKDSLHCVFGTTLAPTCATEKERTSMQTDAQLHQDIRQALHREPGLNPAHIDIVSKDSVIIFITSRHLRSSNTER